MRPGDPIGWPGLIALALGFVPFLAALFDADYDAYAARVQRFVPGIF